MKVYDSGEFFGHIRGELPGRMIPIGASFSYGGYEWLVPAVYHCKKVMVKEVTLSVSIQSVPAGPGHFKLI